MKLPKRIRLKHNVSYKIKWIEAFDDETTQGECHSGERIIYIKKAMSDRQTMLTFIHEILHAMEWEHSIYISHASINQLEEPILRLLKLNDWLS